MINLYFIKKAITFSLCLLFIFSTINAASPLLKYDHIQKSDIASLTEGARLENHDGFKVLYINGSYYEMGYQHGSLLKDEIHENMRAYLKYAEEFTSYQTLLDMWNTTEPYIPSCYIQEMQGIADGAEISFEHIAASYMIPARLDMMCISYSAWSNATIDGRLYHIRSLDFPLIIKDPETGKYSQENSILVVRKPENGLRSVAPSIAGATNFGGGVNEKQIAIGSQICWSSDQTLKGIPVQFRVQKILDTANNISEAVEILTSNKTLGWNFILSDGKNKIGYAVETTANLSYCGTWNDPVEEKHFFWKIKDTVRRTNFFIQPEIASTQRDRYHPGGIISFLKLFTGYPFFPIWRNYKSTSKEIQKNWGSIDLNSSISLLRKVYSGKTDLLLFIFRTLNQGEGILCAFHQWSVCPETGEFVISFADAEKDAHKNQLNYFNIQELMNFSSY